MQESKRQLQVAKLVSEELNRIFTKDHLTMMHGGMVSIAKVTITPDLLEARIFLSLFQIQDKEGVLNIFIDMTGEIRKKLGNALRHQLRRIPTLEFRIDDTLDYVFKMEDLLNDIKKDTEENGSEED